jgi:cytochrome oxidase Cu insertion factor (SCO1/SenC/PrrC family)
MTRAFLLSAALLLPLLGCASGSDAGAAATDDGPMAEYNKSLLAVGSAAPDVVLTDMDDREVKLSSLRGKTLLLNFWFYH